MTQTEFNHLAEIAFDQEATPEELIAFECAIESHPEWLEAFIDQNATLDEAFRPEIAVPPTFNDSVLARWQANQIQKSIQYWAPSAIAAVAAAFGLFAIMAFIQAPPKAPGSLDSPVEARLEATPHVEFPTLREPLAR